jgi:hypothetical protein
VKRRADKEDLIQVDLVVRLNETLVENETDHHSNCERAAAESKAKYLVGISLVTVLDEKRGMSAASRSWPSLISGLWPR